MKKLVIDAHLEFEVPDNWEVDANGDGPGHILAGEDSIDLMLDFVKWTKDPPGCWNSHTANTLGLDTINMIVVGHIDHEIEGRVVRLPFNDSAQEDDHE